MKIAPIDIPQIKRAIQMYKTELAKCMQPKPIMLINTAIISISLRPRLSAKYPEIKELAAAPSGTKDAIQDSSIVVKVASSPRGLCSGSREPFNLGMAGDVQAKQHPIMNEARFTKGL